MYPIHLHSVGRDLVVSDVLGDGFETTVISRAGPCPAVDAIC